MAEKKPTWQKRLFIYFFGFSFVLDFYLVLVKMRAHMCKGKISAKHALLPLRLLCQLSNVIVRLEKTQGFVVHESK